MAEQEQDRTEPATPFKLREARRRGSVAKSLEFASLLALIALLAVMLLWARGLIERQFRLDAAVLGQAHQIAFDPASLMRWLERVLEESLATLLPLLLPVVAVALLGGLLQSGPTLTFHPLKPDIDRINPVSGAKRMLSMRLVFETLKQLVKLALFGAALGMIGLALVDPLLGLLNVPPKHYLDESLRHATAIVFKLTALTALVAAADMVYTRWFWLNQLKMSRREVREELKNREGDPRIRARLRELRREMVKRAAAVRRLPEADVLITNPTHLAVALLYRRETMEAPQVIAKGSGEAAVQMRALARRHCVPVVENPTLARALFARGELDRAIPEALYPSVARLLVWVYALRAARTAAPAQKGA